jgi:hypothetical protein
LKWVSKDFHELQVLLARIDELIVQGGLDRAYVASFPFTARKTQRQRQRLVEAFRCTVLRMLFHLPYRVMSRELACNLLYQKFCGLWCIGAIVPAAKTLERYEKMASSAMLRELVAHLNHTAAMPVNASEEQTLQLSKPVDLGVEYVDATAVKARVHHPVDWVLLRDAVRTLTLAIAQTRKHGVYSRMPKAPQEYLSAMNRLCIEMTHARRTADAAKKRKAVLRRMKKLVRVVEKLAQAHLAKLRKQGAVSPLSLGEQVALEQKFTVILEQIDDVIHQAHERIIGGRHVKNADKILSLYEPDMHVIVRGKAGAEVEFGNTLFLADDGLIVDWHLYREQAPADSRMIPEHVRRMQEDNEITLKTLVGDRGFDSAGNSILLGNTIENHFCPRDTKRFEQRLQNDAFRRHQRRRAQTEARIAIVTHGFLGNPMYKWWYKTKRLCTFSA